MSNVEIFTDGACRGNPGPGGWGALLRFGTDEKELFGGEPETTNNRMELTAVIEALAALKRPCEIKITSDSTYVLKGIKEVGKQPLKSRLKMSIYGKNSMR
jgi:ribonuclease HI